jgi:hypothetical protein
VPILLVSETSVGREPLEIVPSANQVSDYEMLRRQCDIISNENQSLKKFGRSTRLRMMSMDRCFCCIFFV